MKNNLQTRKGFTIIEVVLVLAIAALIILMVFIAWPALQRTQRDQARKNDVALIGSVIGTYKSNNKGELPGICALNKLLVKQGTSIYGASDGCTAPAEAPSDSSVTVMSGSGDAATEDIDKVYYIQKGRCDGNKAKRDGSTRQAAIIYAVEANGTPMGQCQDV